MITKICLNTGTIYNGSEDCTFFPGRINLIFGLNGAGKTSISRILGNPGAFPDSIISTDEVALSTCEVLVYNEDFIEENFYPTSDTQKKQKGIFTLGKENVKLRKKIELNLQKIRKQEQRMSRCASFSEQLERSFRTQKDSYIDTLYSNRHYIEQTALLTCFSKQYRNKADYTGKLLQATPWHDEKLENLIHEAEQLTADGAQKRPLLTSWDGPLPQHQDSIWEETIVPLGESTLQALASKLNLFPWIKQGLAYMEHTDNVCPFCQQELSSELTSSLHTLFDDTYKQLCAALDQKRSEYKRFKERIFQILEQNEGLLEKGDNQSDAVAKDIRTHVNANLELIDKKVSSPEIPVKLMDLSSYISLYNDAIKQINDNIIEGNRKLDNIAESKSNLETRYWSFVRDLCDETVQKLRLLDSKQDAKRAQHTRIIKKLQQRIEVLHEANRKHYGTLTNPTHSLRRINERLTSLGICDIELKYQQEDHTYALYRKSTNKQVYKSLSEGEKTIITFLYFLELCQGSSSEEHFYDNQHKIIVVDDPISSLSSNYVYEIAYLLRKELVKGRDDKLRPNFLQIFVLTHNLYFFNEIASNGFYYREAEDSAGNNITSFWYVSKINNHSSIRTMQAKEICNDYQAFWQVLREGFETNNAPRILPNIMRNILEYFFTFCKRQNSLSNTLSELAEKENDIGIRSLCRYLNRNSHSDATNITPYLDIDFKRFILPFGKVFEMTDNMEHFRCMAGPTMMKLYNKYRSNETPEAAARATTLSTDTTSPTP